MSARDKAKELLAYPAGFVRDAVCQDTLRALVAELDQARADHLACEARWMESEADLRADRDRLREALARAHEALTVWNKGCNWCNYAEGICGEHRAELSATKGNQDEQG